MQSPETEPQFTRDWFSLNIPQWEENLAALKGQPGVKCLEVGVLEGRATHWLCSNILIDPTSRVVCIDTFEGSMEHQTGGTHQLEGLDSLYGRFMHNVAPFGERVQVEKGYSQEVLRKLPLNSFDFAYIDGSHRSADVLEDGVLAFRLLKAGGIMTFDDYEWKAYAGTLDNPRFGIDAFLNIFADQLDVISTGYQVSIRKLESIRRSEHAESKGDK